MKAEWSLTPLYEGCSDENFQQDFARVDESILEFTEFVTLMREKDEATNLMKAIELLEECQERLDKLTIFLSLKQATDTTDMEIASYLGRVNEKKSDMIKAMTKLKKYVASINNLNVVIQQNPFLQVYECYLKRMKEDEKYLLSNEGEEIIAKMNLSGGMAWSDLQAVLTSTIKGEYQGKQMTVTSLRSLAYDCDKKVRKGAYEAELAAYKNIDLSVAFSLNSIKLQVLNNCNLRGYQSPLDETLHNAHMRKDTLNALLEALEECLPLFHKYLKTKADALGDKEGLPWYDLFAPLGEEVETFTIETAKEYLINIFNAFAPDLARMATKAFEEEWIDFYPREGKVGGAFCEDIHAMKESRILTNFTGTMDDVITLAHELGHAYHNYNLRNHSTLNTLYSMPVAETASTFNENIVIETAIKRAKTKEEKLALIEKKLQDVTQIICDIYSRYLFESEVFCQRANRFLDSQELCSIMIEAQKKAYGKGLDWKYLHPYMWLYKGHYYSSDLSFYNFPYAFGGLLARGLYKKYEEEGELFIDSYREFLKATPIMSVEDAIALMKIDVTDKEFWKMALNSYAETVQEFEGLVRER